jgi:hypothetical protein
MRKIIYSCDHCSKPFGDEPHLNIKNINIRKSFLKQDKWTQRPVVSLNNTEKHFCNDDCFINALTKSLSKGQENGD